jgi:hypothetical protein
VRFGGYFLHYYVVKQLLKMEAIKSEDIVYQIVTERKYKPDCFKEFVEKAFELGNMAFKKLCNYLNG